MPGTTQAGERAAASDQTSTDDEAAAPLPEPGAQLTFEQTLQQGIRYYDKHMLIPAAEALRQAAAMPEGPKSWKLQVYLAKVDYVLLRPEQAFPEAELAVELAPDAEKKKAAKKFLEALGESFAGVTLVKSPGQSTDLAETYVALEEAPGPSAARSKETFKKLRERFAAAPVPLPLTLYLPFGKYTANGTTFEIVKGETAKAELTMKGALRSGGIR